MFTGIVEKKRKIDSRLAIGNNVRIAILLDKKWKTKLGDSIAVSGVCLTVADIKKEKKGDLSFFDIIPETLSCTTLGTDFYREVNLERPMIYGSRIHGHIVLGHVHCTGKVIKVSNDKSGYKIEINYPKKFKKYILEKGGITVDGVGLTVAGVKKASFVVALVPHTLKITTLGKLIKNNLVNLEFDINNKKQK